MAPARANSRPQVSERLVLIPAIYKNSTTGYKNVAYDRCSKKFKAQVRDGGKHVHLGYFDTAEEAATAYARSEYGRADAAKLLQPRPTTTAAGAEVIRQAEREGLTLVASSSNNSGYKGVIFNPNQKGSKKYKLQARVGGKQATLGCGYKSVCYRPKKRGSKKYKLEAVRQAGREGLTLATSSSSNSGYKGVTFYPKTQGRNKYVLQVRVGSKMTLRGCFTTAEEAALARARHLWDATVRLLEPQPQQASPQGVAGPSEASYEEEDGFDPADTADATARSLLSEPPPSASEQRAARRQACAVEVEAAVEVESDEEKSEMEAAAVAGVSAAAAAAEERQECAICLDDLSSHPEARLQPRNPNGWGATRCCKNLFHYRCLHTWLNDDSEVETSRGMEPINTACPCCRGFVSKSKPAAFELAEPSTSFHVTMMRLVLLARILLLLCLAASRTAAAKAKGKKSDAADELLYLTDSTLEVALEAHPLLLISVSVPGCGVCDAVDKRLRKAAPELRVKAKAAVKLGQLRIDSPDSPVLGRIVQGALSLPKLIVFREGEALDYTGDDSKESIVKTMLALASRDTVQTLRSVKQAQSPSWHNDTASAERFLHLDSWSSQHADEEKPPRVVGFFPSNASAAYPARKLQGLISFGECFDAAMQRKFLGAPAKKARSHEIERDRMRSHQIERDEPGSHEMA
ncbi:hypothetical protein EMIHUDRAFT_214413 [Emiliania huxleyi CCMP1516]|uniref:RING-type domain-containing protein n=4 Tax=Emiliania huxleyi TaxID=2903 RepID=A0A0D3IJZ6_EMIH1|nr:hypothetical protein EMIHUDRAFT_214413 [Emiliania huxleyi CCMP1516]EOD11581.1 hypothetical protein EMIHUDRAFT_214413 [Emiliania huxleyi CCMP1516]|eukprot:XP_005764010.1 hypothetical protein EMIHUDRAFT_214413 [Emiliania huxleyi CCMP1516]